jgi:hypothetical protein
VTGRSSKRRFCAKADFALGRLGCWRRSHLAPSALGTETFSSLTSQDARHDMNPLSATDVFLTVAIMSVAFLTEIALFIVIGMI